MKFTPSAVPSSERRERLKEEMLYDLTKGEEVLLSYHATRITLSQGEVDELVTRAHLQRMWGTDYVPYGVMPEATRFGHVVEIE